MRLLLLLLLVACASAQLVFESIYEQTNIVNGVPTLVLQVSVRCHNGDSARFQALVNSSIEGVTFTCGSAVTIQGTQVESLINIGAQQYRVEATEYAQFFESNAPFIITAASAQFDANGQFPPIGPPISKRSLREEYIDTADLPRRFGPIYEPKRAPKIPPIARQKFPINRPTPVEVEKRATTTCGNAEGTIAGLTTAAAIAGGLSAIAFGVEGGAIGALNNYICDESARQIYGQDAINALVASGPSYASCELALNGGAGTLGVSSCFFTILNEFSLIQQIIALQQQQFNNLQQQLDLVQVQFGQVMNTVQDISQQLINLAEAQSAGAYTQDLALSLTGQLAATLAETQANQDINNANLLQLAQIGLNNDQLVANNLQQQVGLLQNYLSSSLQLAQKQIYANMFKAITSVQVQMQQGLEQNSLGDASNVQQLLAIANGFNQDIAQLQFQNAQILSILGQFSNAFTNLLANSATMGTLPLYVPVIYDLMASRGQLPFISTYGVPQTPLDQLSNLFDRNFTMMTIQNCDDNVCNTCNTPYESKEWFTLMNNYIATNRYINVSVPYTRDYTFAQGGDTGYVESFVNGQWQYWTTVGCTCSGCAAGQSPLCVTTNINNALPFIFQNYAVYQANQQQRCIQVANFPVLQNVSVVTNTANYSVIDLGYLAVACNITYLQSLGLQNILSCSGANVSVSCVNEYEGFFCGNNFPTDSTNCTQVAQTCTPALNTAVSTVCFNTSSQTNDIPFVFYQGTTIYLRGGAGTGFTGYQATPVFSTATTTSNMCMELNNPLNPTQGALTIGLGANVTTQQIFTAVSNTTGVFLIPQGAGQLFYSTATGCFVSNQTFNYTIGSPTRLVTNPAVPNIPDQGSPLPRRSVLERPKFKPLSRPQQLRNNEISRRTNQRNEEKRANLPPAIVYGAQSYPTCITDMTQSKFLPTTSKSATVAQILNCTNQPNCVLAQVSNAQMNTVIFQQGSVSAPVTFASGPGFNVLPSPYQYCNGGNPGYCANYVSWWLGAIGTGGIKIADCAGPTPPNPPSSFNVTIPFGYMLKLKITGARLTDDYVPQSVPVSFTMVFALGPYGSLLAPYFTYTVQISPIDYRWFSFPIGPPYGTNFRLDCANTAVPPTVSLALLPDPAATASAPGFVGFDMCFDINVDGSTLQDGYTPIQSNCAAYGGYQPLSAPIPSAIVHSGLGTVAGVQELSSLFAGYGSSVVWCPYNPNGLLTASQVQAACLAAYGGFGYVPNTAGLFPYYQIPQAFIPAQFLSCWMPCNSIFATNRPTCTQVDYQQCVWTFEPSLGLNDCQNRCPWNIATGTAVCDWTGMSPARVYSCDDNSLRTFYQQIIGHNATAAFSPQALCAATITAGNISPLNAQGLTLPDGGGVFTPVALTNFVTLMPQCVWQVSGFSSNGQGQQAPQCANYDAATTSKSNSIVWCQYRFLNNGSPGKTGSGACTTSTDAQTAAISGFSYVPRCVYYQPDPYSTEQCLVYSLDDAPLDTQTSAGSWAALGSFVPLNITSTLQKQCLSPGANCVFEGGAQYPGTPITATSLWYTTQNLTALLYPCIAYSQDPLGCTQKTIINGTSQCALVGSVCAPICSTYNNNVQGCIGNQQSLPQNWCYYVFSTGVCQSTQTCASQNGPGCGMFGNNADSQCQFDNCASQTNPCYAYNNSVSLCSSQINTCTYMNLSQIGGSNYCEFQPNIVDLDCFNNNVYLPICYVNNSIYANSAQDIAGTCNIGSGLLGPTYVQTCVSMYDYSSSPPLHCVAIVSASTQICLQPDSEKISLYMLKYPALTQTVITYQSYFAALFPPVSYYNVTFDQALALFRNMQGTTLQNFASTGISVVGGTEAFWSCGAGFTRLNDYCYNTSLLVNGLPGDPGFFDVWSPSAIFQQVYTAMCASEAGPGFTAQARRIGLPFIYAGITNIGVSTPDSPVDDNYCPTFLNDTLYVTTDNYTVAPWMITSEMVALNWDTLLQSFACTLDFTDNSGVVTTGNAVTTLSRLGPEAFGGIATGFVYSINDGTSYNVSNFWNPIANPFYAVTDYTYLNETTDFFTSLYGLFESDSRLTVSIYNTKSQDARGWLAVRPGGMWVTKEFPSTLNPGLYELLSTVGYMVGVDQYLGQLQRVQSEQVVFTATVEIDNVGIFTVDQTSQQTNPFDDLLPNVRQAWLHMNIPELGIVVSPPFTSAEDCTVNDWSWPATSGPDDNIFNLTDYLEDCPGWTAIPALPPNAKAFSCFLNTLLNSTEYQWIGVTWGPNATTTGLVQRALSMNYLYYTNVTNYVTGQPLVEYWNETLYLTNNTQLIVDIFNGASQFWAVQCPYGFIDFLIPDVTTYVNSTFGDLPISGLDIMNQLYEAYLVAAAENINATFTDLITIVCTDILQPYIDTFTFAQCGNCGNMYGSLCDQIFVYQAINSQYTCDGGGMGLVARFFQITNPTPGVYMFDPNPGLQTLDLQWSLQIPISEFVGIISYDCPALLDGQTSPFTCAPENGVVECFSTVYNNQTIATIEGTVILTSNVSSSCNQVKSFSAAPGSPVQVSFVLLCPNDTVVLQIFNLNGTNCFPNVTVSEIQVQQSIIVDSALSPLISLYYSINNTPFADSLALAQAINAVNNAASVSINTLNFTQTVFQSELNTQEQQFNNFTVVTATALENVNNSVSVLNVNSSLYDNVLTQLLVPNGTALGSLINSAGQINTVVLENSQLVAIVTASVIANASTEIAETVAKQLNLAAVEANLTEQTNELYSGLGTFFIRQNGAADQAISNTQTAIDIQWVELGLIIGAIVVFGILSGLQFARDYYRDEGAKLRGQSNTRTKKELDELRAAKAAEKNKEKVPVQQVPQYQPVYQQPQQFVQQPQQFVPQYVPQPQYYPPPSFSQPSYGYPVVQAPGGQTPMTSETPPGGFSPQYMAALRQMQPQTKKEA